MKREAETLRSKMVLWLAPLRAPGALPRGFRLTEIETEQGITLTLASESAELRVELERADAERSCFATTRLFNVYYDSGDVAGVAEVIDAVVRVVRSREHELEIERTPWDGRATVREVEVDRGLVREGADAYYLNPYVGCMLGCSFCYAIHRADLSRALAGQPRATWGKYVDVKVNLPEVVAREVQSLPPGNVRMSPIVTDPYQPIERRYRITRGVIGALAGTGFTPIVLTRASLVREDIPLLARFPRAFLGMSIPTDDDDVRRAFEPATESIAARIETLRIARAAGLVTFAIIQPMLPQTSAKLVALLEGAVDVVRIGPLYEKERALPVYRSLGLLELASERAERATFAELSQLFAARGMRVNPTDGEWSFLRG